MSYTDLPLAYEVYDEDASRLALLQRRKTEDIKPDARLQNWQKWLKDREKTNSRLSKMLKRHPCDLLVNYGESLNSIKEDKLVLEYTKIPYPHDKYRGNPSFFETPVALKRKDPYDPDYFAIRTKEENHLIPEVAYVSIPKCIQKEKELICPGYRNIKDVWLDSAYRKIRVEQLKEQLKIVEPFKPQMEDLCMLGTTFKTCPRVNVSFKSKEVVQDDFQIVYTPRPLSTDEPGIKVTHRAAKHNKHENEEFISLNGLRLCQHVSKPELNIFLDFEYDILSGKPLTKDIEINNSTSVALRYHFTESPKFHLFDDIVKYDDEQVFFFDKRTNIILPSEKKIFQIHFKTSASSCYTSTLQFHMNPKIFQTKFLVKLNAVSTKADIDEKVEILKKYIERKVSESTAHDVLEDILENVPDSTTHVTLYTYDRGFIFESVNQQFSPTTRRPKYIYDKEVVDELETFYDKVRFKGCPPYWNYNVKDLKVITRKREKLNRQKDTLDQIYLMKLEDMQRRKLLGEDINEEVEQLKMEDSKNDDINTELPFSERLESIIKDLKETIANKEEEKETLTTQLENILLKLDTPCYCINNMYDNYGYIYAILCIAIDRIIFDVEKVKDILQIKTAERYPANVDVLPFGYIHNEVFPDEYYPKRPKITQDFTQEGLPPSELVKNIPHDDIKARHLAYFGPEEDDTKGKKGKKGKKDKKKKGKKDKSKKDKKSKKSGKSKKSQKTERPATPQVDLKAIPTFENPFKQDQSDISIVKNISQQSDSVTPEFASNVSIGFQLEEYKFNLYKIFYKHLSQAVMRIADVIETNKPRKLKLAEFQTTWLQKKGKRRNVKVRYIDIKKALCKVLAVKVKKKKGMRKKKGTGGEKVIKLAEPLRPKEAGSQWSILKPFKQPQPSEKPISYPELCLLLRRKHVCKESVDVATIMSVCSGFDPNWQDFKEVSVQAESEPYRPSTWESKGVASGIVQEIVSEVCDKESAENDEENTVVTEELGGEEEESDVFFDEDFSDSEPNLGVCDLYNPNV